MHYLGHTYTKLLFFVYLKLKSVTSHPIFLLAKSGISTLETIINVRIYPTCTIVFFSFYNKIAALGFLPQIHSKSGCLFFCYSQVLRAAWCVFGFSEELFPFSSVLMCGIFSVEYLLLDQVCFWSHSSPFFLIQLSPLGPGFLLNHGLFICFASWIPW